MNMITIIQVTSELAEKRLNRYPIHTQSQYISAIVTQIIALQIDSLNEDIIPG
jgi:hypothetical protein